MAYALTSDRRTGGDPARDAFAITPSDTVDMAVYPKALYVGVTGDVVGIPLNHSDDTTITLKAHPVGYCPVGFRRIFSTGTTATNIIGMY